MTHKSKGKFRAKWEGPFVVKTIYLNGIYDLAKLDSELLIIMLNSKFLKKNIPDFPTSQNRIYFHHVNMTSLTINEQICTTKW